MADGQHAEFVSMRSRGQREQGNDQECQEPMQHEVLKRNAARTRTRQPG
jgi:hypothetical protein